LQDKDDFEYLTTATKDYVNRIRNARDLDKGDGGGRLVGHLYCRYLADLFGGQQLATPTRLALRLEGNPKMYEFELGMERGDFIEALYGSINVVGDEMTDEQRKVIVEEAAECFELNKVLYAEGGGLYTGSLKAGWNLVMGFGRQLKPSFGNPYARGPEGGR
jgi:heme oxygenase